MDGNLPGAVARAAHEDDVLGGRASAVARAGSREHENVPQPTLIPEERTRELKRQLYSPYSDMRHVCQALCGLLRVPESDPREYYTIETSLRTRVQQMVAKIPSFSRTTSAARSCT